MRRLQAGHGSGDGHEHGHDHEHGPVSADWGAELGDLEHPDERTDEQRHNWGAAARGRRETRFRLPSCPPCRCAAGRPAAGRATACDAGRAPNLPGASRQPLYPISADSLPVTSSRASAHLLASPRKRSAGPQTLITPPACRGGPGRGGDRRRPGLPLGDRLGVAAPADRLQFLPEDVLGDDGALRQADERRVREVGVDLLVVQERQEGLGRAPGVQRIRDPEADRHDDFAAGRHLVHVHARVAGADRQGRGLRQGAGQAREFGCGDPADVDAVEVGQSEPHHGEAQRVAAGVLVQFDQAAQPQGREDAVHRGLGKAEPLGDLGHSEGDRTGLGEQDEHVRGAFHGGDRLTRRISVAAADRLRCVHGYGSPYLLGARVGAGIGDVLALRRFHHAPWSTRWPVSAEVP